VILHADRNRRKRRPRSSTSHLVFSRIVLERLDSRYVVTERET
jgi:hypothetical protein